MGAASVTLSLPDVLSARLQAQHLIHESLGPNAVADLVGSVGGLQAQDPAAARLAVRARSAGLTAAQVERARVEERSVVRTWSVRGTLHLVRSEDLAWLLPLVGPPFIRGNARRCAELGLDEPAMARALKLLTGALADHGPLTRAEVTDYLAARGLRLEGQARPHLLGRAALEGLVCFGPDREGEPTYVRLDDWLGPLSLVSREAALSEVGRRYLSAYAPAGPDDLAAWSGLPRADVRAAWQATDAASTTVDTVLGPLRTLAEQSAARRQAELRRAAGTTNPTVRLLGAFDTYLLGYRSREPIVDRQFATRINAGGGLISPVILVDGQAVGTWRLHRKAMSLEVRLAPFERLTPALDGALEAEAADVGRVLGGATRPATA
jgi:hypothetical protein